MAMVRRRDKRVKSVAAGYPGGKAGLGIYHRIINEIPPHDIYIELFLGGGSIMYYKRPARFDVGVDINSDTIADARPYLGWAQLHTGCGLDYLRHLLAWQWKREGKTNAGASRQTKRHRPSYHFPDPVAAIGGAAGSPRIVVYADPPYVMSTRRSTSRIYEHEVTDQTHDGQDESWHRSLLNLLNSLSCHVLLSGYESDLYKKLLPDKKWRAISYSAPIRGGKVATEFLWCNFPKPSELHDYRYLGKNRRERERIKRKINRWKLKLNGMPDLERYAILGAIQAANFSKESIKL